MNLLSQLLAISTLILLVIQGVNFYQATVCRSRAWEKSFVLITRGLFPSASEKETSLDPGCKSLIQRQGHVVHWRRNDLRIQSSFQLSLEGKL